MQRRSSITTVHEYKAHVCTARVNAEFHQTYSAVGSGSIVWQFGPIGNFEFAFNYRDLDTLDEQHEFVYANQLAGGFAIAADLPRRYR